MSIRYYCQPICENCIYYKKKNNDYGLCYKDPKQVMVTLPGLSCCNYEMPEVKFNSESESQNCSNCIYYTDNNKETPSIYGLCYVDRNPNNGVINIRETLPGSCCDKYYQKVELKPPVSDNQVTVEKAKDIKNAETVIVQGNVLGDIKNCGTVVIINGDVEGDIKDCKTIGGYLSDKYPDKMQEMIKRRGLGNSDSPYRELLY